MGAKITNPYHKETQVMTRNTVQSHSNQTTTEESTRTYIHKEGEDHQTNTGATQGWANNQIKTDDDKWRMFKGLYILCKNNFERIC